jgi:hypothetical protein
MDKVPKKKIVSVNFIRYVFYLLGFLTPENGTNRLFHDVGKELPLYAAQYPRRAEISPDDLVMQALVCFHMVLVCHFICEFRMNLHS